MIYTEDALDFAEESKTYRKALQHRKKCEKWGKGFCLDCFGGGLTQFAKDLQRENLTKHNNDLKKVCPECGCKTSIVNESGDRVCNQCNHIYSKPIIKS